MQQNGYFQIVEMPGGYGVAIHAPKPGGEGVRPQELIDYLDRKQIRFDINSLKKGLLAPEPEKLIFLCGGECPAVEEYCTLELSEDNMRATVRFVPASAKGKRLQIDEVLGDLRARRVTTGIRMDVLEEHFATEGTYGTDLIAAEGTPPRHGTDARVEYYFNTDLNLQPTMKEDGSVDYFHLNIISQCKKDELLARVIPADEGEFGVTIQGAPIHPRQVKKARLEFGRNITASEDRSEIFSDVNGHVSLIDGKVFVSDVYAVENVGLATGNINFEGSVEVGGDVAGGFEIIAGGNVIVRGVVEGAHIKAGGNIIIARGMNGMGKGVLEAGGNVVAKFLESTTVKAGGYVNTESILHSTVTAHTDITVSGKRGFITGGSVRAGRKIEAKTLGATMGAATVVEVGVDPERKAEYLRLQKDIGDLVKNIKNLQPVLTNFAEKKKRGASFSEEQLKYLKNVVTTLEGQKKLLEEKNARMQVLQQAFNPTDTASVRVSDTVYPGTTIVIGDSSMTVQKPYQYCRFERIGGDVRTKPL